MLFDKAGITLLKIARKAPLNCRNDGFGARGSILDAIKKISLVWTLPGLRLRPASLTQSLPRVRPTILNMLANMTSRFWDFLWRLWYPVLTRLTRNSQVVFLNYGYGIDGTATTVPVLENQDEADRVCIQLYHHVVTSIDVRGLRVLEVSCGHGGGASYVTRYLNPKSLHGIDRNARAIAFCKRQHQVDGLTFSCGDALALDFAADEFDVVVNIEASHCYPDIPRFFNEVRRILRPGGHCLYADFRSKHPDLVVVQRQLEESGLQIVSLEDISRNVVRGMELNNDRYLQLIQHLVGKPLRSLAMKFAGVKGSAIYDKLKSGETVYFSYVLRKPVGEGDPPGIAFTV
jgi:ubiquinone/menaquinone biosynthesis C-methylase UbiE